MPGSVSQYKIVNSKQLPNDYRVILSGNQFDEYMVELFHNGKRIEQLEFGGKTGEAEAHAEYNLIVRVLKHAIKIISQETSRHYSDG